ncbi:MAG TPA: amino acid adenylation domain-containing protein [Pyrinomonadaceae bacterium]
MAERADRPFDLAAGPLFRVSLFRRADDEHVLLLAAHHIVIDFWSLALLVSELGTLYEAGLRGEQAALPPAGLYDDYVRRQRRALEGAEGARLWDYWRERLGGELPTLDLPTDRPRPPAQTFRGASHAARLDAGLARRLKALERESGATLYTLLLAAFQVLLSRHTGQDDVVVGSPAAGRGRAADAGVVGYFVNPLVLRADLSGDPTFGELLAQVRRTVLDAFAHQDYPFPLLVQRLQPERDQSRPPLFQAMFVLQQTAALRLEGVAAFALGEEGARMRVGGLNMESVALEHRVAQFDLSLAAAVAGDELLVSWEYNTDLFDAATVGRMAGHFETLLRGIVEDPGRRLSELPLLTGAEERRLLVEWNETAADYPRGRCLQQLFEEQAERTPDAVALVFDEERLTYAELNARADRLANYLRSLGVGAEALVGVMSERSREMVVALLGVLKAGGAYVPLDPAYPAQRVSFMLEDAQVKVLLTQESLAGGLPPHGARVVLLDADWPLIERAGAAPLRALATDDNLAYVIYTSGSTGRPKGVAIAHASAVTMVRWALDTFTGEELGGVLASTSICFDLSVFELFVPLSRGGKVILAADALALAGLPAAAEVRLVNTVPSAMAELVRSGAVPETVLTVNLAGEPLQRKLVEQIYERTRAGRVLNLYGPSEDTTYSTFDVVESDEHARVTIGRPIADTRAYLLDARLRPVPQGVTGELYLGGAGLARGYLGRPALTAERFVPDPFSGEAGARLYRTGDLARFLPDGRMEYLGRADFQIKLRGFRIELGEIEAALAQHPSARECLVAARAEGGETRLVAYVLREPGEAAPTTSDLRRFLAAKLPDYMIPSVFVHLDEWPLTPNGKIDRRALPAPTPFRLELEASFVAPRDQSEELLASIFAAVLGVERVGSDDNFFDLGGHSLLATQVIARVRDSFLVELPLRDFFRTPTVAGLARELARALGAGRPLPEPIVPAERAGVPPPLSFAQQRLWFLDQLEDFGRTAYNIPVAIRLRGRLDARALELGLGEIVNRHEALRTTFAEEGGEPVQVIAPPGPWALPVEEVDYEGEALRRAAAEARERFDLARGPLLRARLLRVASEHHVLLLTMHHIVSDGWSIGVLVRELVALYEAFSAGRPSPLAPLPVQYADYVRWQRARLGGELLEAQMAYWRKQLGGELPALDLPSNRPAHAPRTYQAAAEPWKLAPELGEGLRALGRRHNATLYMTLLGAFQSLLSRYTAAEDLAVGTPVAGRLRVETEGLIGVFVNMLVMRGDLSGDPTFAELLERTREVTLEAHANQEVPFEMLVEELRPERDFDHAPLFQVMLVLQNAPLPALKLGPLSVEQIEAGGGAAKFDLILFVREDEDGIGGTWEYDADRFDAATVGRMAGHFETLLRGIVEDPGRRLSELPLLTGAEERRLLVEWNDTRTDYPRDACVQQLFEEQAERTPDAVALVFGEDRLTYAELNARANQIARRLRTLGVGPEVIVGLCLERSMEMVVSLLGVLKAGGAYLPLDPEYPLERLSFMMEDAAVSVLLTQERLKAGLPAHSGHTLFLDAEWGTVDAESAVNLWASCSPDNLAYVMYTSGSTGRPKGVSVTHRAVVRLVRSTDYAGFGPSETFLQLAPASFDASTFEVWGALLNGARLALMPPGAPSLEGLAAAIARHGVTTLWLTAGLFHQMVDSQPEALRGLRQLLAGGDVLSPSHVARLLGGRPGCVLINGYGPTENTTFTCTHRMGAGWQPEGASVPIGRPIGNTRAYVLDSRMAPAPAGVAGELYAAGDGLARGYLGRAGLTAERFVPDPFSAEGGGRLYRTGDRARWLGGGELEFLGRLDGQVKVRGFRIEPGEIEAALGAHQLVREAAVVLREDAPGDKRVVAYVACDDTAAASRTDWRGFLRQQLPEYMIPSAFVCLAQLPLTPNGKLDRRALPAPEFKRDDAAHARLAPRTPVEAALLDVWRDLLHVARPGLDDNFFDLGGHSLLATQVLSRVRGLFGVEIPLRALFEGPTPAGLAAHVESRLAGGVRPTTPPLEPTARDAALPLSFAQQRLWIMDQLEPGSPRYNLTQALRLRGSLDSAALERGVEEIVRRHEVLRTTFAVVGRTPAQVIHPDATVKPDFVDLCHLPEAEREAEARRIADAQALHRFDLAAGPLLRVSLLRLGAEEHVVVLTLHHIISDGWSIGVWVGELTALYNSYRRGLPASLPALPVQYADFAKWQHELVEGGALSEQLAYWKRQLADAPPPLELPFDRERPARPTFGGATLDFDLPAATCDALRQLSRREGVTLYMALLAGFKALLHRYTGREDVTVGAAIANRNHPGVEGLIGFFVNMLAMRTDLSGDPTFRALLGRVRETALGAYAHQDVPFDTLVNALRVERQGAVNPLFQTLFILQNAPLEALELAGLTLTNFEVANPLAHLDLIFSLQETDGRLTGLIQYSTELFEEETVAQLLSGYRELLEVVAADPEKRLSELGVSARPSDDPFTLRDLPEVKLSLEQLAGLLQEFDEP